MGQEEAWSQDVTISCRASTSGAREISAGRGALEAPALFPPGHSLLGPSTPWTWGKQAPGVGMSTPACQPSPSLHALSPEEDTGLLVFLPAVSARAGGRWSGGRPSLPRLALCTLLSRAGPLLLGTPWGRSHLPSPSAGVVSAFLPIRSAQRPPAARWVPGQASQPGVVWPWDAGSWPERLGCAWEGTTGGPLGTHPKTASSILSPAVVTEPEQGRQCSVEPSEGPVSWAGCTIGGDRVLSRVD